MTKKEWMKRARILDKEIKQLNIAKQEAYEIAVGTSVDISKEKVQSSKGNSMEKKFVTLLEYDLRISRQKEKLLECKAEILEAISRIEDIRYRAVLIAYYINCKSWEEVAVQMNYGIRQIYRLHGNALQKIKVEEK